MLQHRHWHDLQKVCHPDLWVEIWEDYDVSWMVLEDWSGLYAWIVGCL